MSFVLDALKVSERKRSRLSRRIYAHPPRPRRAGRMRKWLALPAAVAAVALLALGWRLIAPVPGVLGPLSSSAPGTNDSDGAPASDARAVEHVGASPVETVIVEGEGFLGNREPARAGTGEAPEQQGAGWENRPAPPAQGGIEPALDSEPAASLGVLAAPPPDWPALSLQMLFFSEEESRRFVQVNGKTYRQGERLAAGPEVRKIGRHSVTLAYRGQQILLGVER